MFPGRLLVAGAVFALVLTTATVRAQGGGDTTPTGLDQVPADAPLVLHLRGIEGTKDRLLAMLKTALPDQQPTIATALELLMGRLPGGRELKGLSKDGPIFVVFTELPDLTTREPKVAILIGVTNYKEFRDAILSDDEKKTLQESKDGYEQTTIGDRPTYFVDRSKDGLAIVTADKDTAAKLTKKPAKGLDKTLHADLAKKLTGGDLPLYVDMVAINKKFAKELKDAREQIEKRIESGGDKNAQEMAKKVIAPMFQALTDSTAVLATLEFRKEGLNLALHGEVDAKSKTNDLLKDAKPGTVAELDKLPAGMMAYTALQIRPALLKEFGSFFLGALGAGDPKDEPSLKAVKEALELLTAAKPTLQLQSSKLPAQGLSVTVAEDPAKAVEAQLKVYQGMKGGSAPGAAPIKGQPEIKLKAEKHQGFELHFVSFKWDLEKLAGLEAKNPVFPNQEKLLEIMKAVLGEGQNIWFGTDGKVMITVAAKDVAEAKELIDQYVKGDKSVGAGEAFKQMRKQLPADTTALVIIDVPLFAEAGVKVMKPLLEGLGANLQPNFGKPAVKGETSFMGYAVTLQPQRGSVDLFVSAKAVHEVYKMYLQGLLGGGF